ncbi:MAG TPA: choice-of-anchor tandem repeat GloVer-containing protein [Candidatus Tumulicola sp.]|jgi:uncharacterized repeat protein (TIGR03803 family)
MQNRRPFLLILVAIATASLVACSSSSQGSPIVPPGGSTTEKVLHSFAGTDGSYPDSSLVALNSLFFGTTVIGGGSGCPKVKGCGTVYSVDAAGHLTVLVTFAGGTDGEAPNQLLLDSGELYGTTEFGGGTGCTNKGGNTTGCGTVFQLSPSGVENIIYRFPGGETGALPSSGLTKLNSVFYGEAAAGGKGTCYYADQQGCGLVYSVTKSGIAKVIYTFAGGADAASPTGGLTAYGADLYGTSTAGGANPKCGSSYIGACGTVFKVSPSGTETVLHRFSGKRDGAYPDTRLVLLNGTFYGTTSGGGGDCGVTAYYMGCGTVFSITPSGTKKTIHNFAMGSGGNDPSGLFALNGVLYGTTVGGGDDRNCECGTFFKMSPSGQETVLYSFTGKPDAAGPSSPFLFEDGTFYGVSGGGGSSGLGTVFSLTLK